MQARYDHPKMRYSQVKYIRDKFAFLNHMLGPAYVIHEGIRKVPPSDLWIDMGARKVFLTWDAHFRG